MRCIGFYGHLHEGLEFFATERTIGRVLRSIAEVGKEIQPHFARYSSCHFAQPIRCGINRKYAFERRIKTVFGEIMNPIMLFHLPIVTHYGRVH